MDDLLPWLRAQIAEARKQAEHQSRDRREGLTDDELHQQQDHPAYEYRTLEGGRKTWREVDDPPEGDGWELNITSRDPDAFERFDYTEERYWRRLRPDGPAAPSAPYVPAEALRVLAQCEAHTALLDAHPRLVDCDDIHCGTCITARQIDVDYREDWSPAAWPCPSVRAVALAYQHHPGYREEWRP